MLGFGGRVGGGGMITHTKKCEVCANQNNSILNFCVFY